MSWSRLASLLSIVTAISAIASFAQAEAQEAAQDGAQAYSRCAACHLPSGAGVPGAFPRLTSAPAAFARTPDGRLYLALALIKGVSGPIVVDGESLSGFMPAQGGLTDAQIAAVLNYIAGPLSGAGGPAKAFSAEEIAAARASAPSLGAADVARTRPRP